MTDIPYTASDRQLIAQNGGTLPGLPGSPQSNRSDDAQSASTSCEPLDQDDSNSRVIIDLAKELAEVHDFLEREESNNPNDELKKTIAAVVALASAQRRFGYRPLVYRRLINLALAISASGPVGGTSIRTPSTASTSC